ncbi:unnamed protein product, partial [Symbiodinium sp. CCMP2456]
EVHGIRKDLERQLTEEGLTQGPEAEDEDEEKAAAAAAEAARLAMATAAAALEAAKAKKLERLQREAKAKEEERRALEFQTLKLLEKEQRAREAREKESKERQEREAKEKEAKETAAREAKEQEEAKARQLREMEATMKEKEAQERETKMKEAKERETQARLAREAKELEEAKERAAREEKEIKEANERAAREAKEKEEAKARILSEARPLKREADHAGTDRTQDRAGDSVGRAASTTLVDPDASAATMAKQTAPNLGAVPKASKVARKAKDDDFALPVLSDAEKGKYKIQLGHTVSPPGTGNYQSRSSYSAPRTGNTVSRNGPGVSQSSDYNGSNNTAARASYTQCQWPDSGHRDSMSPPPVKATESTEPPPAPEAATPAAAGNGLALEAVLRFKRQHEDMSQDEGHYYPYNEIVEFFSGNEARAMDFCRMRSTQFKGTSTDRNNPEIKTYLYFQREKRMRSASSLVQKRVMSSQGAIAPPPPPGAESTKPGGKGDPKKELKKPDDTQPKKKARGSELEIDITTMMAAKDFNLDEFVTNWVAACTAAEGRAAPYVEAFKKHGKVAANLNEDSMDLVEFWNEARSEDWGANHPVQSWSEHAYHFLVTVGKLERIHVIKSDFFHYNGDRNITLEHLQADLVQSLNRCADKDNKLGATLHVVAGKADWKFRREWLQQTRFYGKVTHGTNGICARCFAAKNDWLDVKEKFNNDSDVALAQETAVGENIAMKQLSGWSCNMEGPDLLHCIWLGTGRDLVGSLCMEMAENRRDLVGATYDERLSGLHKDMQAWCAARGIRASTIDGLSFLLL